MPYVPQIDTVINRGYFLELTPPDGICFEIFDSFTSTKTISFMLPPHWTHENDGVAGIPSRRGSDLPVPGGQVKSHWVG